MLATPRVERHIERTHSLRGGWTVRVGNIDRDAREPSTLQVFRMVSDGRGTGQSLVPSPPS